MDFDIQNVDYDLFIDNLNTRQREIFDEIIYTEAPRVKYHIIRASRQCGKTEELIRLVIYFLLSKQYQVGAMVSASHTQFADVWKRLLDIIPEESIVNIDKNLHIMTFDNGSTLQFFTAKNYNAIAGKTFDYLFCDEVGLYPKDALSFMEPVIDKKKAIGIYVSTPYGKNDFYEWCNRGESTDIKFRKYKHYKMSYLDREDEDSDIEAIEEKRKIMVDAIFRSLYLAEFIFGTSSVFGEFKQYQKIEKEIEPVPGKTYYGGLDWSGAGEDATSLVIENEKGEICFIYECLSDNIPEQVDELALHIKKYNNAFIKSEVNGLGLGGTEMLQIKCPTVSKFWMSNKTKNDIVSRAKKALFNKTLILPSVDLYPKLDNEMTSYIVTRTNTGLLTYRHEKDLHDDVVDAMLMANYQRELLVFGTDAGAYIPEESNPEIKENYWEGRTYSELKEMQNEEYDPDD